MLFKLTPKGKAIYVNLHCCLTKYRTMETLNRNVLSHSSGDWKSEISVSRVGFLEAVIENLFHASSLAAGLLAIFNCTSFIEVSPQFFHFSSHDILPICVSVSKFPLFIKTLAIMGFQGGASGKEYAC